jgi:hypothetical protein
MAIDTQEATPGTREHFLQVTRLRRWGTIQGYVDLCRAQGYFTPAFYATAIAHMERIHVRRRLKQITNARGWPVFGNIARVRDDGRNRCSCRRSSLARRSTSRSSPTTTAWRGTTSSRHRPTVTTPRRVTGSSCRSSKTTARGKPRRRLEPRGTHAQHDRSTGMHAGATVRRVRRKDEQGPRAQTTSTRCGIPVSSSARSAGTFGTSPPPGRHPPWSPPEPGLRRGIEEASAAVAL